MHAFVESCSQIARFAEMNLLRRCHNNWLLLQCPLNRSAPPRPRHLPLRVLLGHLHQDQPDLPHLQRLHEGQPEDRLHLAQIAAPHMLR